METRYTVFESALVAIPTLDGIRIPWLCPSGNNLHSVFLNMRRDRDDDIGLWRHTEAVVLFRVCKAAPHFLPESLPLSNRRGRFGWSGRGWFGCTRLEVLRWLLIVWLLIWRRRIFVVVCFFQHLYQRFRCLTEQFGGVSCKCVTKALRERRQVFILWFLTLPTHESPGNFGLFILPNKYNCDV